MNTEEKEINIKIGHIKGYRWYKNPTYSDVSNSIAWFYNENKFSSLFSTFVLQFY